MAALQPSAKKHKTTMLQADDNTFNHLNTQDLFIATDHPLLDPAAMEDSQMWMQDWHEDDLDHLIEPQQQQKQQQQQQQQDQEQEQGMDLQSQDMFSSNSSVGNKENLPNRETLSDIQLTSTPSLPGTSGRPDFNESIIELQAVSTNDVRPALPLKRRLFQPHGMSKLVSDNSPIEISPLLTQKSQQSQNIKSSTIVKHLDITEKYKTSDECHALMNSYPASKSQCISYVKPILSAGKKNLI